MVDLNKNVSVKKSRQIIIHVLVFTVSISLTVFLLQSNIIHQFLESSREVFLLSAFIGGLFFSSALTTAPAIAILYLLGQDYNPILVSIVAAAGSVMADILIFKLIRDNLISDLEILVDTKEKLQLHHFFYSKILHLPLIVLSALIIASPLPDELGISILATIKFKMRHFYVFSFLMNFLGILTITTLGSLT